MSILPGVGLQRLCQLYLLSCNQGQIHSSITSLACRKLFPPTKFSAEFNARIAALGFYWLVGESEVREGDVEVAPGVKRTQNSIVHIKKCRYLEHSGCVGMCVNMCKVRGWMHRVRTAVLVVHLIAAVNCRVQQRIPLQLAMFCCGKPQA